MGVNENQMLIVIPMIPAFVFHLFHSFRLVFFVPFKDFWLWCMCTGGFKASTDFSRAHVCFLREGGHYFGVSAQHLQCFERTMTRARYFFLFAYCYVDMLLCSERYCELTRAVLNHAFILNGHRNLDIM